jgi:dolichol-phosphate mannosyltransferase
MNGRILVIVPTYNEAGNITKLIPQILEKDPRIDVLVVDDSSPDGTSRIVQGMADSDPRIRLMTRPAKLGLGTAYVEGFRYALKHSYSLIFEMDADFSHDPREIPKFIEASKTHDLVLGSRYIKGVNVVNWPLSRLLLSWFANRYTRFVTRMPVRDATGGYKCFHRRVLEAITLDDVRSDGYAFQIEMTFKAFQKGFRVIEIPIVFVDRSVGDSKMSSRIVSEAVMMVWKLRFLSLSGKL